MAVSFSCARRIVDRAPASLFSVAPVLRVRLDGDQSRG